MGVKSRIQEKLTDEFQPSFLKVENESNRHHVPEGSETHFKVVIVSEQFAGIQPVKRHQEVYRVVAEELQQTVHALALHTFTLDEWQSQAGQVAASPNCKGA